MRAAARQCDGDLQVSHRLDRGLNETMFRDVLNGFPGSYMAACWKVRLSSV